MVYEIWIISSAFDPDDLPQHIIGPGFGTYLAMGKVDGYVYVWDLSVYEEAHPKQEESGRTLSDPFTLMKPHVTVGVPKWKKTFRMMAWSTLGELLVGVGDRGLLCLWQVGKID